MVDKEINIVINTKFDGAVNGMNDVKVAAEKVSAAADGVKKKLDSAFTESPAITNASKNWKQFRAEAEAAGKTIEQIKTEWKAYNKAANEASGASKLIQNGFKDLNKNTQSLRAQLRQVTQELAQMDIAGQKNSARYTELAKRAGVLKDAMNDANQSVKNFGSDTRHIDGVLQGVQGLIGTYSIFQGVLGLTGTESEKLQQVERKMQSLLGIMIGLQQVQNLVQKESAFMQTLMAAKEKVLLMVRKQNTAAIVSETAAMETQNGVSEVSAATTETLGEVSGDAAKGIGAVGTSAGSAGIGLGVFAAAIAVAIYQITEVQGEIEDSERAWEKWNKTMGATDPIIQNLVDGLKALNDKLRDLKLDYQVLIGDLTDADAEYIKQKEENTKALNQIEKDRKAARIRIEKDANDILRQEVEDYNKSLLEGAGQGATNAEAMATNHAKKIEEINKTKNEKLLSVDKLFNLEVGQQNRIFDTQTQIYERKKADKKLQDEEELRRKLEEAERKRIEALKKLREQELKFFDDLSRGMVMYKPPSDLVKKQADLYVKYYNLLAEAVRNKVELNPEDFGVELPVVLKKRDDNDPISIAIQGQIMNSLNSAIDSEAFKARMKEEDLMGKIILSLFGNVSAEDMESLKRSFGSLGDTLMGALDLVFQNLQAQTEAEIDLIDKRIEKYDELITAQEDAVTKQEELAKQGSASNIKIEKDRLAKLKADRDQALKDRDAQIQKEKKQQQTLATINAAVGAISLISQSATEGGIPGLVAGIAAAAAFILEIAAIYGNVESAVKFAHGTAEILGGKPHSQGGTSLGPYGEAEKGEFLGILNKQQTAKYGPAMVSLFDGLNQANNTKATEGLLSLMGMRSPEVTQARFDAVELKEVPEIRGIYKEMKKGKRETVYEKNRRIEKFGNVTRIIYN